MIYYEKSNAKLGDKMVSVRERELVIRVKITKNLINLKNYEFNLLYGKCENMSPYSPLGGFIRYKFKHYL